VRPTSSDPSPTARSLVARVTAVEAPASQRPVFDRLLEFYKYDFSEFAPIGSPHGELDAEGRFPYPGLESYWQDSRGIPLLIRADDRLAGFALVNQWSALGLPLDHVVAEFFVMRKYRRARVGTRAALSIFRRYPGRWEVPVAWYNPPALAFWRRVTQEAAPGKVEEIAGDGQRWAGPVLCFDTGSRQSAMP
jgi:predicted acetyltransferase